MNWGENLEFLILEGVFGVIDQDKELGMDEEWRCGTSLA